MSFISFKEMFCTLNLKKSMQKQGASKSTLFCIKPLLL